jgi:CheY-like chemotaxis protein
MPVAGVSKHLETRHDRRSPSTIEWDGVLPLIVLVADDCIVNQLIVSALLSRWGITPVIACDGAQAVHLAGTRIFDIIFMDIVMPVMDGLEPTARIRALECGQPTRPRVPVVAYTTVDIASIALPMRRVGMNSALRKPADADAMFRCLAYWCASRWPAAAHRALPLAPAPSMR